MHSKNISIFLNEAQCHIISFVLMAQYLKLSQWDSAADVWKSGLVRLETKVSRSAENKSYPADVSIWCPVDTRFSIQCTDWNHWFFPPLCHSVTEGGKWDFHELVKWRCFSLLQQLCAVLVTHCVHGSYRSKNCTLKKLSSTHALIERASLMFVDRRAPQLLLLLC